MENRSFFGKTLPDNLLVTVSNVADGNMSVKSGDRKKAFSNRNKFFAKSGVETGNYFKMELVHGDSILSINHDSINLPREDKDADAVVTIETGLPILLLVGDCIPMAIFDDKKKVLAVVHLGWRCVDDKLPEKVIRKMIDDYNSNPEDLLVYIGPAIRKESYRFKDPIQKSKPKWHKFLEDTEDGNTCIDIVGYIKHQLTESGVPLGNIYDCDIDTATSDKYYSHYIFERTGLNNGRFAMLAMIKP